MSWLDGVNGSQEHMLSILRRDDGPIVHHGMRYSQLGYRPYIQEKQM